MNARQTNASSMRQEFPTDTSFDRVDRLKDAEFNFGASRAQNTGAPVFRGNITGGLMV